jgi:hypothetical protein
MFDSTGRRLSIPCESSPWPMAFRSRSPERMTSSVALVARTSPDGAGSRRCPVAFVPTGDIAAGFSPPFLHNHPITASVTPVKPHGCHRYEGST